MEIVQIIGIIFAAAVILILAYLYRESAIIEGKTEIGIGPVKFKLGGHAQVEAQVASGTQTEETSHDHAEP